VKLEIGVIVFAFLLIEKTSGAAQFDQAKSQSIFTDIKGHKVGDLITVLIVEDARASNRAKTITKKDNKIEAKGGPGSGTFDFIPLWGISGENKNEFDGEGQLEKAGSIRAKMTVKVIALNENGDLVIEGSRVISVNADKETLFLSGIVRQRDVSPSNTIYSYQVGDAQVSFKGKGQTHDGARPGLFVRILNWIF
jgi:flagellar L-ring protein precursor FlgH